MRFSRSIVTIAGLAGFGLCRMAVRSPGTSTAAEHDPAAEPDPATASPAGGAPPAATEIAELRQEGARLRRAPSHGREPPAVDPAGRAEAPAVMAQAPGLGAGAEQEQAYRAYMHGVDAAFREEAIDPPWSSATSSVLRTALAAERELPSLVRGVECRSHTCRVELADGDRGKLGALLPMFAQHVGNDLPGIVVDHRAAATGAGTIVLYLSRQDETQAMGPVKPRNGRPRTGESPDASFLHGGR